MLMIESWVRTQAKLNRYDSAVNSFGSRTIKMNICRFKPPGCFFFLLLVTTIFISVSGCRHPRSVPSGDLAPRGTTLVRGQVGVIGDNDTEQGRYDNLTFKTAEVSTGLGVGGGLTYFPADNVGLSVDALLGQHDFESSDDIKLGTVDLELYTVSIQTFSRGADRLEGIYGGAGLLYANFRNEEPFGDTSFDISDHGGYTLYLGMLSFLSREKQFFIDARGQLNSLRPNVTIREPGNTEKKELRMIDYLGTVSFGIRF